MNRYWLGHSAPHNLLIMAWVERALKIDHVLTLNTQQNFVNKYAPRNLALSLAYDFGLRLGPKY